MVLIRSLLIFSTMTMTCTTFAATPYAQIAASADVYLKPDFRSKILGRLNAGTLVPVSVQKHVGAGGMGVFYKIRMPTGELGFVTDTDVVGGSDGKIKIVSPPPQIAKPAATPPALQPAPQAPAQEVKAQATSERIPTIWGATLAAVDYSEKIRGKTYSQNHIFIGPRRTSSASSPTGWRHEIGFLFTVGAPRFLAEAGAYGDTSGYIALAEYLLVKPFVATPTFSLYAAAGSLLAYSKYTTQFPDGPVDESSFRPGVTLDVGASFLILGDKYLKIDGKILIEQVMYYAPAVSLQFPF